MTALAIPDFMSLPRLLLGWRRADPPGSAEAGAGLSARQIDEALRDSGLSPDDLLGPEGREADRPFFLRPRFGAGRGE